MKRHRVLVLILALIMILSILAACAQKGAEAPAPASAAPSAPASPAEKPVDIKVNLPQTKGHSYYTLLETAAEDMKTQSNGVLNLQIFDNAQLGTDTEGLEAVQMGSLEMNLTGLLCNIEPLFAVLEMPYLYKDREHASRVYASDAVKPLKESALKKNVRIIAWPENGYRQISNNKRPINSPADLKGLKIRTAPNTAQVETFNAFGALVMTTAFNELYNALQQGVADGQENPLQNIYNAKMHEVQKYISMTNHIYGCAHIVISEKFFQNLSAANQKIMEDTFASAEKAQKEYVENLDKDLIKKIEEESDVTFNYPDQKLFEEAVGPAYEALYAKLPGSKELVEAIRSVA